MSAPWTTLFCSDIAPTTLAWLWPRYLPRGKLTLLDGDPEMGKSLLTLDLIARLSRGGPLPDGTAIAGPLTSILLSAEDLDDLRQKLTHAEAVIAELRAVVADLRRQIDAQLAHIHRLVKMTFGRSSERAEGPTLFDGLDADADPTPTIVVEAVPEPEAPAPKRKGHGRRPKPKDLPRRPEVIDLTEAEKVCPCCGSAKARLGPPAGRRLEQPVTAR
jgi:hypothetical protein